MLNTHGVEDTLPAPVEPVKISPVADISQILADKGHPAPRQWEAKLALSQPDVFRTEDFKYQRFLINRFWRTELGLVPGTLDARYCIIEDGTYQTWLDLFRSGVAPCIIKHSLHF